MPHPQARAGATRRELLRAAGALALLAAAGRASADTPPPEVAAALPGARLQGSGLLRFFGLRVYDARLWVGSTPLPASGTGWAGLPLALELKYARRLVGRQIAERSLQEMRRQGEIAAADAQRWLEAMTRLFPDVTDGDRITGVNEPGVGARFFVNGREAGAVAETAFAQRFFGIWLAEASSEPALRQALLGAGR